MISRARLLAGEQVASGLDVIQAALAVAGIQKNVVQAPLYRLSPAGKWAAWATFSAVTRNPDAGFVLGERTHADRGIVSDAIEAAPSLGEILRLYNDTWEAVGDPNRASLDLKPSGAWLRLSRPPDVGTHRAAEDFRAVHVVRIFAALFGAAGRVRAMHFTYSRPQETRAHQALAPHAELRFSAPDLAFAFSPELLHARPMAADPVLYAELRAAWDHTIAPLRMRSIDGRAGAVVGARLDRGERPRQAAVAAALRMSERSLQRALQQHGTSFQEVLDRELMRLAAVYLQNPTQTLSAIAARLDFANPSAFRKAFARWTGQSTEAYRRSLQPDEALAAATAGD